MAIAALLVLAPAFSEPASGNDQQEWESNRGLYRVSYSSELHPVRINRIHNWVIHVEDTSGQPVTGASLQLDGGMPEHDHGLPTRPQMTRELGSGDYLVEGVRFHMTGNWLLELSIEVDGTADIALIELDL